MNVFETVKGAVTAREAAEMYGIEVKRNGMAVCPFHDDRNPSMKVDKRFHCFGCGEDGDAIDFTSRLYNLSPKEAAEKLAQDFGLAYDSHAPVKKHYVRQKTDVQIIKEKEQRCFLALSDYYHQLRAWETEYAPAAQDEAWNPLFVEALQRKGYVEYLLDVLISGSIEEKKALIADCENEIKMLEQRRKFSMPEKLSNKDRLRQITDNIEAGIKELFESDKYRQYLSTMSRFHRYSLNNTMLIYLQKPDATLVAGFNKWKNQFERHVKKGEHGITIIAPTPFKKKIEEQKLDPDTKAPVLDKNGKIVTEEKEVEIPMFRPVKVFDVSQTDGKPLPQLASDLSGNVRQYDAFMEALRRTSPVPIAIQPVHDGSDGYFSLTDQRIAIREGMSEVQTVSAAVHEIAHSILHNREKERLEAAAGDETKEPLKSKDRRTEEVEAESISYAVCQYYGIQTGDNSFGYIAAWSKGKELPELKASLETINKTASGLITEIDRHFKEICKERGIDLAAQPEQTVEAPEHSTAAPEPPAAEMEPPAEAKKPDKEEGVYRYYITQEAMNSGTYPFMLGGQIHEEAQPAFYENGAVQAFGYIDYPQALPKEQAQGAHLVPSKDNPPETDTVPEPVTYYVAECMEFPSLGEYHENLSLEEAVRLYEAIPAARMNGIKGIGFELHDGSGYAGTFPILSGTAIDLDSIDSIDYFRENPQVQKAVSDLMAAMPHMEVIRPFGEAQEKEVLFLLDGANYLHIQESDEGYDYTIYDAKSRLEVDGGCLANQEMRLPEAMKEVLALHEMPASEIKTVDLSLVEELQDAQPRPAPRRYAMDENGEMRRTWNGKLPEQFTAEDTRAFMAETASMLGMEIPMSAWSLEELLESEEAIVQDTFFELRMDDMVVGRGKDGVLTAEDDANVWRGKEVYDFLLNEAIVYEPDGSSSVIPDGHLDQVRQLASNYGVSFPHMDQLKALPKETVSMLPDAPEQMLDEYPMPDPDLSVTDLEKCGYLDGDMLPLSKEQAAQLYEKDLTVYAVTAGGHAEMLFDREDFETHGGTALFAVPREEWEASPLFHEKIQDRLNHQEEREAAFLNCDGDCFAIYQVSHSEAQANLRFMNMDWLERNGLSVERTNYDLVYTGALPEAPSADAVLEQLYTRFNIDHPTDYHSPSMSVSDIVVLKQAGAVSCHYVDSVGFSPVPDFIKPENYLKAAEISTEDDYGMIDGIINNGPKQPTVSELEQQARSGKPISLMDLAAASHREEQEKKPSVVGKLKSQPKQETKKTAPKKNAEREI